MNIRLHINPEELHHAYALVGEPVELLKMVLNFVENDLSFSVRANPDFWMSEHATFTIDDARALANFHLRKPIAGSRKVFVIRADALTIEAQNALLKLFEEPGEGNHFFLILSEDKTILLTLRSRMQFFSFEDEKDHAESFGRTFIDSSLAERLKLVSAIADDKDKAEAKRLVHSLIDTLHEEYRDEKSILRMTPVLKDLVSADDYLSDRAPSIKMLLEHIAHVLP
jgi:DNA polymerase III delta prime subunit